MKLLFMSLLFFVAQLAEAQKNSNHLKFTGVAEITTGLFSEGYNTGWGAYVTDYFGITDQTSISLSSGIASWKAQNGSFKVGLSLTRLGLRQFVSDGFYFQADGGIAIGLQSWSGTSKFAFDGGLGYLFKSKRGGGFDLSAKANRSFNRTWIGLAAGYEFKLH